MFHRQYLCFLILCLVGCEAQTGCGPRGGQVSGKVYFGSEVLKSGTVIFVGSDGQPVHSPISKDGSYCIEASPPGTVQIAVVSHSRVPFPTGSDKVPKLPEHYQKPDQSHLAYEVVAGKQTHDIRMDSASPKH